MKNHLILGNWNALCDSCGRKFKANQLQKRWDGLMVCEEDWEQRHPQDLLRVQREQISVPWARPYPAQDNYIPENLWYKPDEAIGIVEVSTKAITKVISDAAMSSSNPLNANALNSFAINATDLNYLKETFILSETLLVALARYFSESISVSETVQRNLGRPISESIPVGESWYFTESEHTQESLSLAEAKTFLASKAVTETVSVAESTSVTIYSLSALNGAVLNSQALG